MQQLPHCVNNNLFSEKVENEPSQIVIGDTEMVNQALMKMLFNEVVFKIKYYILETIWSYTCLHFKNKKYSGWSNWLVNWQFFHWVNWVKVRQGAFLHLCWLEYEPSNTDDQV